MSLKLAAELVRLKAEIAVLRGEVTQVSQRPTVMFAELSARLDRLEAAIAARKPKHG